MDSQFLIIVISVLVIIAIAAAVWIYAKKTKSERLQRKFGPEYDQTVERLRNREVAEAELHSARNASSAFASCPYQCRTPARTKKIGQGAGTEELRQAFVHYRVLFDDLLESRESHPKTARPFLRGDRNANRTQSRKINRGGLDT
jgi:hypothetical protein